MDQTFLNQEHNQDIIALLAVSNLPLMEKRLWVNTLEFMTDEEKKQLRTNLEEEIGYETKITEQALGEFIIAMKKS